MHDDANRSDSPRPESPRLSRRTLLVAAAALAGGAAGLANVVPASAQTPAAPQLGGTPVTYYVSNAGSDTANGLTEATAWQTPAKVNAALTGGTIGRGDTVRFRSGDEFFGGITTVPAGPDTGPVLTLTSYGTGARPRLSGYKICNPGAWTVHAPGVWKINLAANSGAYTGNVASPNVNVGFLRVAGVIKGAKRSDVASLAADWDFYSDESQFLYVRLATSPAGAGDVRAAVAGHLIIAQSSMTVTGLELQGSGSHGYSAAQGAGNLLLSGMVIREIGGSRLTGTIRFGNGVQIWIGGHNVHIQDNEISDVYDVAVTYQGPQAGTATGWNDVHATGNTIHHCNQSFEMWCEGTATGPGTGFVNCSFSNNNCSAAGYSWGAPVRPDHDGKGTHLLFYHTQLPSDLTISGNTFDDAEQNYCYFAEAAPTGLVINNNTIKLKPGRKMQYQRAETIANAAAWAAATGFDQNSTFVVL